MKLEARIERLFMVAWTKLGKPMMTVVRPVAEWQLPDGYTYDESVDAIRDDNGDVVNGESYRTVNRIPVMTGGIEFTMRGQQDMDLVMANAGLVSNTVMVLRTLPTYTDMLKTAFAAEVDGISYYINGVKVVPEGAETPAWVNVTLKRR